jgi:hypothetical protein
MAVGSLMQSFRVRLLGRPGRKSLAVRVGGAGSNFVRSLPASPRTGAISFMSSASVMAAHPRSHGRSMRLTQQLLNDKRSFLLVSGHFPRSARWTIYNRIPPDMLFIRGDIATRCFAPSDLRTRLQEVKAYESQRGILSGNAPIAWLPDLWKRDQNWSEVGERRPEVQNAMLAKLAEPGGVGLVLCDA